MTTPSAPSGAKIPTNNEGIFQRNSRYNTEPIVKIPEIRLVRFWYPASPPNFLLTKTLVESLKIIMIANTTNVPINLVAAALNSQMFPPQEIDFKSALNTLLANHKSC